MADTTAGPATADAVRLHLGLGSGEDPAALERACAGANAFLRRYKTEPGEGQSWSPDYVLGTIMLAAQLYRRRNTPGGVEQFGETGVYVRAIDADVERLLRIGRYSTPGVG